MLGYWFLLQLMSGTVAIGAQGGGVAFWAHVGRFRRGRAAQPRVPQPRDARAAPVLRLEPERIADAELASRAALSRGARRAFGPFPPVIPAISENIRKLSALLRQHASRSPCLSARNFRETTQNMNGNRRCYRRLLALACAVAAGRRPCGKHRWHPRAGCPGRHAGSRHDQRQGRRRHDDGPARRRHLSSSAQPDDEVLEAVGDGTDTSRSTVSFHAADPRGEPHARRWRRDRWHRERPRQPADWQLGRQHTRTGLPARTGCSALPATTLTSWTRPATW